MPAAAAEEWVSAKTLAVGGAGRAIPLDNSGLVLNPATVTSPTPSYSVEMGYQRHDATRSDVIHVSAQECTTSFVGMGIAEQIHWSRPPFDPTEDLSWYDADSADEITYKRNTNRFALALGYGLLYGHFNLGAALRVYRVDDSLREVPAKVSLDVGLDWWLSSNVALAVSGGNLVPTKLDEEPTTLAVGFGTVLLGGALWLGADGVLDFTSGDKTFIDLRAGGQVTLFRQLNLRGGFSSDRLFLDQFVSWGIGWTAPGFSASYGMRVELGTMDHRLNDNKPEAANRLLHAWSIAVTF